MSLLVLVTVYPMHTHASTVLPVGLSETVAASELIVVGTVSRLEYGHVLGDVFTKVHLTDLNLVKGGIAGDSLTIQITGGIWKGDMYKTVSYPEFEVGERYGLCLDGGLGSEEDHYQPITFWNQGFFPFLMDSSIGRSVLHDCYYFPVVAIEKGNLLVRGIAARPLNVRERMISRERSQRDHRPARPDTLIGFGGRPARIFIPAELDPGVRLDEAGFVREIRGILKGVPSVVR